MSSANSDRGSIFASVMAQWAPPPEMTVSEWADERRQLSAEASAEPGRWRTSRVPYLKGIMDAINDPSIRRITVMCGSQLGKSEAILNIIGSLADIRPCPILVIQPTVELAQDFSKDRIAPMIRDTESLRRKVAEPKAKVGSNTLLHKSFPGGNLTLVGANSPAGLAGRPKKVVLGDEVDRFPLTAGTEGNPFQLGVKRTSNFWDSFVGEFSTPTDEETSQIWESYQRSDQRLFFVPCLHCGEFHTLQWKSVLREKDRIEEAAHFCPHCGCAQPDAGKEEQLANGDWRAQKPEVKGWAGFRLSGLYSPWRTYAQIVREYFDCKDDPLRYRVFVNTTLGWVWRTGKAATSIEKLLARRENYTYELVPMRAVVLIMSVDIQDDRVEYEVIGWGRGFESWSIQYGVILGAFEKPEVQQALDAAIRKTYLHESGVRIKIMRCGIDSGGHYTSEVYKFCKPRYGQGVFAVRGIGGQGKAIVYKITKMKGPDSPSRLVNIGTNEAKDLVFEALKKERPENNEPCPWYMHFPSTVGEGYFKQLTAERPDVRIKQGRRVREWVLKKPGLRNEALDCRVYNIATLKIPGLDLEQMVTEFEARIKAGAPTARGQNRRLRKRSGGIGSR